MPTASVKALRPESRHGFQVVVAQEWVRERFWVVPTALLIAGMAVGLAVSRADSIPGVDRDTSFFPSIGAVNLSVTAIANLLRVGDHITERLR